MLAITNESDFKVSSGIVAVKFWATWCGPCKRMNPIVDKMESEFEFVKFLSIDVDQVPSIAQRYKIRALPTLIILKNGKEINRINGLVLTSPLRKAFREATDTQDGDI